MSNTRFCMEPGCNSKYYSRGFCRLHYYRHSRANTLPPKPPKRTQCDVSGCPANGPFTRGYCKTHYARVLRHGDAGGPDLQHAVRYGSADLCRVDDCTRGVKARGYCPMHYKRVSKTGRTDLRRRSRTWEEAFARFTDKSQGCWQWTGTLTKNNYGLIRANGKSQLAHRWSYEHHVGPIPSGLVIDHLCRNRACVNPDHMEPVTNEENLRRGAGYALRNGMRTACIHGHEYTPRNTYISPSGDKRCRTCSQIREANRGTKLKEIA